VLIFRLPPHGATPFPAALAGLLLCAALTACGPTPGTPGAQAQARASTVGAAAPISNAKPQAAPFYATVFERKPSNSELTELGRALFHDAALSASGQLACASCHSPAHAYGPANSLAVQPGGADMKLMGLRAVPSLMYQQAVPAFTEHFFDTDGDDSVDQGPAGGRTWDGRAPSAHEQAVLPLLSPLEMANADMSAAVARLRASPNAQALRQVFGPHVLDSDEQGWRALLLALEVFQQSPRDFYPYSSKYDAFLRGQAQLSAGEARGLALFNDRSKGNCAFCHTSAVKRGAFPAFTDYGFIALGVPRNGAIAANADPAWNDLGLCGPLRTDLKAHGEYCGLFRTPSLRNVATRQVFFHNGKFHSLTEAVRFYALRDVQPQRYYPRGRDGKVNAFDDLPARYRGNVNSEAPFGGSPGDKPRLSEAEIQDVVAFLKTLTDQPAR
jgi:cytochrome c peroxidase